MKFLKAIIASIFFVFVFGSLLYADDLDALKFENAKRVVAKGPATSGVSPYGLIQVITYDGRCFEYLTDKGQFVKYKSCEEKDWVVLEHNFIKE